jgi:dihydroorotate dehydrogenase (NAD+) catalytic subunit
VSTSRRDARPDLTARVGSLVLPNPIMTASGTAGHGAELAAYLDLSALGAVVVKSLSPEPWAGNPPPRVRPLAAGMLNSVGLQNPGIGAWLEEELPALAATGARIVVSIWGHTADDYGRAAKSVASAVASAAASVPAGPGSGGAAGPGWGAEGRSARGAAARAIVAVEANVSCPNVEDRRRMFAHSCAATAAAIGAAADALSATGLPLWAKLSPNVTDLTEIGVAALDAGADGVTLVNTLMGLAIDPASGRPLLGGGGGGLSGPALHPIAVRAVYDCRAARPDAVIIGVGGVSTGADAAELLAAGADAVQVGTATFADPRAPARILAELERWCGHNRVTCLADLIGRAHEQRQHH